MSVVNASDGAARDAQGMTIILSGFATIGTLALVYLFYPAGEDGKEVVMTAIGIVGGFLAGRKRQ